MFSKACEYGIKALMYLSAQPQSQRRVGVKEVSAAIDSPEAFTAKILQQLARQNIVHSTKGPHGGFELIGDGKSITLAAIVEAIDGNGIFINCALGLKQCSETHPCPVHDKFKVVRDYLSGVLHTTNLQEINDGLVGGLTHLKRN